MNLSVEDVEQFNTVALSHRQRISGLVLDQNGRACTSLEMEGPRGRRVMFLGRDGGGNDGGYEATTTAVTTMEYRDDGPSTAM